MRAAILGMIVLTACGPSDPAEQVVNAHRKIIGEVTFQTLTSEASCQSPEGTYRTQTESDLQSDYLLFQQWYDFKPDPFRAVIFDTKIGFGLDSAMRNQGALSEAIIGVLKGHEFHEIAYQPHQRFHELALANDTLYFEAACRQLNATDRLGYPVKLFFSKNSQLMEGFSMVNPYRKKEVISVHFENWDTAQQPPIFGKVRIRQGNEGIFTFSYEKIQFDSPDFTTLAQEDL